MNGFEWLLLDAGIKSVAVLTVAGAAAAFMRRQSAAARHAVWAAAVTAVLALPVFSLTLPRLSVLPELGLTETTRGSEPAVETATPGPDLSGPHGVVSTAAPRHTTVESSSAGADVLGDNPAGKADRGDSWLSVARHQTLDWLPWIWLGGAAASLVPVVLGAVSLIQQRRAGKLVAAGPWRDLMDAIQDELAIDRPVRLLVSPCRGMPMMWGWDTPGPVQLSPRPTVLLPEEADQWPTDRLRAVLLHELAHVKRRDCLWRLLGQVTRALYWFNPLTWLATHLMLVERERACDDLVLIQGVQDAAYAEHLLAVVQGPSARLSVAFAGIAMARRSGLERRLRAVLDRQRRRQSLSRVGLALLVVLMCAVAGCVAALHTKTPVAQGEPRVVSHSGMSQAGAVVRLPEGIEVELVGVAAHRSAGGQWWNPQGRLLDEPVHQGALEWSSSGRPSHDIALRIRGQGSDGVNIEWPDRGPGTEVRAGDGLLVLHALSLTGDVNDVSLKVAQGPWRTLAVHNEGEGCRTDAYQDSSISFLPAHARDGQVIASVAYNLGERGDYQVRLVAVDRSGEIHVGRMSGTGNRFFMMSEYHFKGLTLRQIKRFLFQVRPYRRVTFHDVSLEPGRSTTVRASVDREMR